MDFVEPWVLTESLRGTGCADIWSVGVDIDMVLQTVVAVDVLWLEAVLEDLAGGPVVRTVKRGVVGAGDITALWDPVEVDVGVGRSLCRIRACTAVVDEDGGGAREHIVGVDAGDGEVVGGQVRAGVAGLGDRHEGGGGPAELVTDLDGGRVGHGARGSVPEW